MNILIVVPGGVDEIDTNKQIPVLISLFEQLGKHHHVVIIALQQYDTCRHYRLANCEVITLTGVTFFSLFSSIKYVIKVVRQLKFSPDIVHSFWLGYPTILGKFISTCYQIPLFASICGGELVDIKHINYGGIRHQKGRFLNRLSLASADGLSAGSEYLKNQIQLSDDKAPSIIPLGLDSNFWPLNPPIDLTIRQNRPIRILHIGSINPVKDLELLIAIATHLRARSISFTVSQLGVDTLNGQIQRLTKTAGLCDDIRFYGLLSQQEARKTMAKNDIIIQTSWFESQGVAVAEAITQGLIPVGTQVGWFADMHIGIPREANQSRQELASKICDDIVNLIDNPDQAQKRVSTIQDWLRKHNSQNTAEQFLMAYRRHTKKQR
ncbi:Putative glycosyltransferase EpsF [BD1-7 clade bacterium]|uniref:Glycosyltransferase EpsF n=1 Tax=BD1-7 clade bacterium TaxID=2029982 RepID=A0A5S9PEI4_9GAMM|nr:Putative glycosyltransferase EpsF [BD1-7 clade bacterium]